jgi:hypothetical protein
LQKNPTDTKKITGIKKMIRIQEVAALDTIAVQEVAALDTIAVQAVEALDTIEIQEVEALDLIEVQKITDVEKCTKQLAATVEMNVKYHSSQNMTDQFIAKNVSKITNRKNAVEALDLAEVQVMAGERVMVKTTEVQDTIKVKPDSKKTVLQLTVETILEQQDMRQIMMNPIEKILGIIILIHFILL